MNEGLQLKAQCLCFVQTVTFAQKAGPQDPILGLQLKCHIFGKTSLASLHLSFSIHHLNYFL